MKKTQENKLNNFYSFTALSKTNLKTIKGGTDATEELERDRDNGRPKQG